jgi:hypothetical protein
VRGSSSEVSRSLLRTDAQRGDVGAELGGQGGQNLRPVVFGGTAGEVRDGGLVPEGLTDAGEAEQLAQLRRLIPISG